MKKYSIYFLQDTHFTKKEENYICSQWGFECFFSSHTSQSRGVAIFFNNNFDFNGNRLVLDVTLNGVRCILINIYGREILQIFKMN